MLALMAEEVVVFPRDSCVLSAFWREVEGELLGEAAEGISLFEDAIFVSLAV